MKTAAQASENTLISRSLTCRDEKDQLPSGFKVTRWAKAGESSTALALAGSDVVMKSR